MQIDLAALHAEVAAALRESELRTAELRGQLAMIVRLANAAAQQPIITHDSDDERHTTNGHALHTGPLV